jgi:hypothetical protein
MLNLNINIIFYYWLAAIGMCFIMKHGSILESFRQKTSSIFPCLSKLYKCCLCMGFWAGVIISVILKQYHLWSLPQIILFPFTCSCICWYADSILSLIHVITNYYSSSDNSKPIK